NRQRHATAAPTEKGGTCGLLQRLEEAVDVEGPPGPRWRLCRRGILTERVHVDAWQTAGTAPGLFLDPRPDGLLEAAGNLFGGASFGLRPFTCGRRLGLEPRLFLPIAFFRSAQRFLRFLPAGFQDRALMFGLQFRKVAALP